MQAAPEAPAPAPQPGEVGPAPSNVFGEPVAAVTAVQALLYAALSFGWLGFIGLTTQDDLAAVVVLLNVVGGLYVAYKTHRTMLGLIAPTVSAVVAVLAIYGTHVSVEQTALIVAAIQAVIAAYQRSQVSPLRRGSLAVAA